ncbi:2-oxo acid dehydrogenase subunit E2 [Mycolicibacter heraklionensis]|uniref:Dihydrolipoamide acetyltransferase component of pyruvate dehydrogenase complex n=1 Tax=Mycolicibacter heraklionensis TaxID=512402 RepID=A0A9X7WEP8_9MYCO|nr:dihydrolipoamide acetyltransferase family protein [Mycolicibacter heraklionensis]QZA05984.1 2-oxo acid dehydrogenase subunit E2 [Mycolicibacter heraklionensis]
MITFRMPALGSDMDEGTLNEWLIKPGDTVTRGQVVAVVETTKAAVEVECWQEGTVGELMVGVGETVQVGAPLATLLEPGEAATAQPAGPVTPAAGPAAPPTPPPVGQTHPTHDRRRWVSPAARRLADATGIDVETLRGTGPQGAVTIHDVEHAAASAQAPTGKQATTDRAAQVRRSIGAAMSRSKREIPHYYLADEVVLDTALAWLTERNAQRPITERLLPAILQVKAVALAAQRFGEFNGFWRDDEFHAATAVHVGMAITLRGGGLVAPALHDVANKPLNDLMNELTDLVARARLGSLRSSEMSDPTITVTNLGDRGVAMVFGVIYPPQVALVGFGKPAQRVCAVDGGIRIATTVQATLAADHRASDGHRGALFLAAINELLQQPDLLEG